MSEPLTSLQNPRVKDAVRLRQRRHRDRSGRFLIEGYRELNRAVAGGFPIETLFICPELYLGENEPELVERAVRDSGADVIPVVGHVFEKLAYRDRPEGLLAVAPRPEWTLDRLPATKGTPFYVVACTIEKPPTIP